MEDVIEDDIKSIEEHIAPPGRSISLLLLPILRAWRSISLRQVASCLVYVLAVSDAPL